MEENTLVVYYSLTGNTRFIAETIKEAIKADILEIQPVKEINPEGMSRYLLGGLKSVMNSKPELKPIEIDPISYDLIFLGSPVWAWDITPPMRSFLEKFNFVGKKIALWLCSAHKTTNTFRRYKALLEEVEIVGQMNFIDPLKSDKDTMRKKVREWAKSKIY